MSIDKKKICEIPNLNPSWNVPSVYDLACYSYEEMQYLLASKINELIRELMRFEQSVTQDVIEQNKKLEQLLNGGLIKEIEEVLDGWVSDGTLDNIINQQVFGGLNQAVANLQKEIQDLKVEIEQNLKAEIEQKFDNVNEGVESVKESINQNKSKIDDILEATIYVNTIDELTSALAYSESKPLTIYVVGGVYVCSTPLVIPSHTKIVGLGSPVFKKQSDSDCNALFITKGYIREGYNGAEHITIEGLVFDGEHTTTNLTMVACGHAKDINILNCEFKNLSNWHMIEINSSNHVMVDGCRFTNYGSVSGGSVTEAIQIDQAKDSSVFPWFGPYDGTVCQDVTIQNCVFEAINNGKCIGNHSFQPTKVHKDIKILNNHAKGAQSLVDLSDVDGLIIKGNHSTDVHICIRIGAVENYSTNIIISDNHHVGMYGQVVGDVEGRFIWTIPNPGKQISNVVIHSNTSQKVNYHHIGLECINASVVNNVLDTSKRNGIFVYSCNDVSVSGNVVLNVNQETNGSRGPIVVGASDKTLERISITGNTTNGNIVFAGTLSKVICVGNVGTVTGSTSSITHANNV